MPVLSRPALESSPLADLHAIAAELGLDGFRRLRKTELVDAILKRQGGGEEESGGADASDDGESRPSARRRRGGRGRGKRQAEEDGATDENAGTAEAVEAADVAEAVEAAEDEDEGPSRSRRGRRGGRSADRPEKESTDKPAPDKPERAADETVEGVIELLSNGSAFVRLSPPEPSEDDVYVSAAQVRRCELVSGDRVSGPMRPARRSERYPSLVRVETINGRDADEVAEGTRFDDLPAAFPTQRLTFGGEDPTLKAIEWLTPIGRGSRVTVAGAPASGKTQALLRLAGALAAQDGLELSVVLCGARPEELALWKAQGLAEPVAELTLAASADAQGAALERAVETAKRLAARGDHAVVLVDGLGAVAPAAARKALGAARAILDGGSLTVIATAPEPVGGETTVVAMDGVLASTGRFPALDLAASRILRPELLVGDAGAEAIAQARRAALDQAG
ncbi:MAG TPA: Rho termination factor N-terminal domain-containing protein [Solirubrobacteraceae bacterium]|nr:Rho termination factor N-terminal domain-containing protein [Solirubrobacteraceae bacterium]